MSKNEDAKKSILALKGKERYQTMIEVTAILTELLEEKGVKPVVVGGLAVEVYTRNQYTTLDVDLVTKRRDLAAEALGNLGFIKEGRHWFHPEVDVSIEIPGDELEDADENLVTRLELSSGRHIYVIGLEDIIMDRLRACIYWKSSLDCEWARRMIKLHYEILDLEYLIGQGAKESPEALSKLNELLETALN